MNKELERELERVFEYFSKHRSQDTEVLLNDLDQDIKLIEKLILDLNIDYLHTKKDIISNIKYIPSKTTDSTKRFIASYLSYDINYLLKLILFDPENKIILDDPKYKNIVESIYYNDELYQYHSDKHFEIKEKISKFYRVILILVDTDDKLSNLFNLNTPDHTAPQDQRDESNSDSNFNKYSFFNGRLLTLNFSMRLLLSDNNI